MAASSSDVAPTGAARLTRREREVAGLVSQGLTNRQIAERLFISERTVEGHVEQILRKLEFSSRSQVAAWVAREETWPAARPTERRLGRRGVRAAAVGAVPAIALLVIGFSVLASRPPAAEPLEPFAGDGTAGYAGDGLPATKARLNAPLEVAAAAGQVYVADYLSHAVRRIDGLGVITTVAGGGALDVYGPGLKGTLPGDVNATSVMLPPIQAVAPAPDGTVFFCGGSLPHLYVLHRDHTISEVVLPREVTECRAAVVDPRDGSLLFADRFANLVRRRSPEGGFSVYAGTGVAGFSGDGMAATAAQLSFPTGLAIDAKGALHIADQGNNRIRKVDPTTGVMTTVAGSDPVYGFAGDGAAAGRARLALPGGIALDRAGHLFIADTENNRIRYVRRDGTIRTLAAGGRGFGPSGLAVFGNRLLIADTAGNRIVAVSIARLD